MAWCQTDNKPLPQPVMSQFNDVYRQVSNIRRTKSQHLKDSRILLPTKVRLILEVLRYMWISYVKNYALRS